MSASLAMNKPLRAQALATPCSFAALLVLVFAMPLVGHVGGRASPRAMALGGPSSVKFDFGPGRVEEGYQQVVSTTVYTATRGYGFVDAAAVMCVDRGGADAARADFCTSDRPFAFAVDLPEGNYRVTVTLGDRGGESLTTVKAESRRLMLERVRTGPGEVLSRTFAVNIRNSRLAGGGTVALKEREIGAFHWDDQLTVEFGDARPAVAALEIEAVKVPTVFLAGDSTVTDQTREPYYAWGQMLTRFFQPTVAVANHAESGETLMAFARERRFEKIFDRIGQGDYLFIQFAHNDMKEGPNHLDPFTTYQATLERLISDVRARGATPVLVTPMHRRRFDEGGRIVETFGDYPEAMRQTARKTHVVVIDLHEMSRVLYEALGPETSRRAFLHLAPGSLPGQVEPLADDTHFSAYGAYELARSVVEGIRSSGLPLAKALADDVGVFDPARPDPVDRWFLPASPPSIWAGSLPR